MATLFGCDEKTIRKGIKERANPESLEQTTIRRSGGGRKCEMSKNPDIDEIFWEILREHTAGDPMDEKIKWTNLTRHEIREKLNKKGIKDRYNIVRKLLKKHGFVKRKALKKTSTGQPKNRDKQFKKIASYRTEYENSENPIISIDASIKESIGNLYREGHLETTETIEVFDHDFPNLADKKVTPYAIYDLKNNESFVNIGTSCDTSDFVCDSIKMWWNTADELLDIRAQIANRDGIVP
ncbi:MAG: ISAzo13 family transposase [Gammaproteobacteria bacterium]|nr:MAG: ISAzo13 family transposase [Gammaproteobacteria bacterium]